MVKIKKTFIVLLIVTAVLFVALTIYSNAYDPSSMMDEINNLEQKEVEGNSINAAKNIGGAVITITRVAAAGVAVIMLIVLAMKYMSAAPSDRADIKKHAVVYVVGAVCMFAVSGILGIIQNFANVINN